MASIHYSLVNSGIYFPQSNTAHNLYFSTPKVHFGENIYIYIYSYFTKFKFVIMLAVFKNKIVCILDMIISQAVFKTKPLPTLSIGHS